MASQASSRLTAFFSIVEVPIRTRVTDRRTMIVYWVVMVIILLYGGIYMFWKQRGYQASGNIAFSSEFRFKGTAGVTTADGKLVVMDTSELVQTYTDGFFIATNYAEIEQRRGGTCPGFGRSCNLTAGDGGGCPAGSFVNGGYLTGACLNVSRHSEPRSDVPAAANLLEGKNAGNGQGYCELKGWCPAVRPGVVMTSAVQNWGNITWWWRVNIKYLSGINANDKSRTWTQELGPFTIAMSTNQLEDPTLSEEVYAALGPGQPGADVALSVTFFCNLDNPTETNCGLRKQTVEAEDSAPFAAFRLDPSGGGFRTGGALLVEADMTDPSVRLLRNMTGLRLRLAITGESREADLYTTLFNLGTLLWVTFLSQFFAEVVLLRFSPNKKLYGEVIYRDINERHFPAPPGSSEVALPARIAGKISKISSQLFDSVRFASVAAIRTGASSGPRLRVSTTSSTNSLHAPAEGSLQLGSFASLAPTPQGGRWRPSRTDSDLGLPSGAESDGEHGGSHSVSTSGAPTPAGGAGPGARRQLMGGGAGSGGPGGVAQHPFCLQEQLQSLPESPPAGGSTPAMAEHQHPPPPWEESSGDGDHSR